MAGVVAAGPVATWRTGSRRPWHCDGFWSRWSCGVRRPPDRGHPDDPGITHGEHDHPPAEVCLPLAPGEWRNAGTGWTNPGTVRLIDIPHGIRHAMRSGRTVCLALWFPPLRTRRHPPRAEVSLASAADFR